MTQRHPIQNDQMMLVTTITKGRIPYFADPAIAREAVEAIYRTQHLHAFFLFGFVIMPDHCHILINVPPPETISMVMKSYKSSVVFSAGLGPIWQQRFHILLPTDPWKALDYIHLNPVRAGLVDQIIDYPWSSGSGKWDVSVME